MKKLLPVLVIGFCMLLGGCNARVKTDRIIPCDHVIAAYENAGYEVFHKGTTMEDWEYVCYVKATDPKTQEYIFFHFFETHEKAAEYAEEREYNVLIWLFSVIYGDPTWQTTKVYNNIEIEYDDASLYKPFEGLTGED